MDGREFESPSGVVRALTDRGVNGWYFWRFVDGRRLKDLRDDWEDAFPELRA